MIYLSKTLLILFLPMASPFLIVDKDLPVS